MRIGIAGYGPAMGALIRQTAPGQGTPGPDSKLTRRAMQKK